MVGGGGVEWNFSVQPRPKLNNTTLCTGGTGINTFYSPFLYLSSCYVCSCKHKSFHVLFPTS